MSRVPPMRTHVPVKRECDRLLGVVWVRRGFWRRPVAKRFECGGQLRVTKLTVWCPVCRNLAGKTWESKPAPRTLFTFTERRRERALQAALRAGGLA